MYVLYFVYFIYYIGGILSKPDIKINPNDYYVTYKEYVSQKYKANYLKQTRFIQNYPDESNITINIMNNDVGDSSDESSSSSSSDESSV